MDQSLKMESEGKDGETVSLSLQSKADRRRSNLLDEQLQPFVWISSIKSSMKF
jgi:hypothetical protein